MDRLHVLSLNCQGKGGTKTGIQTIISVVNQVCRDWHVLFLSEVDFHEDPNFDIDLSPHWSRRHHPGQGSRAMRFVVNRTVRELYSDISWNGRFGVLQLVATTSKNGSSDRAVILGLHGPHSEDELAQLFCDASSVLASCMGRCKILATGDWNVDELPATKEDPFFAASERLEHHLERRTLRNSWLEANSMS